MYCAFFAPDFRLQAALRYRPHLWEQPVAIVVEDSVLVELTEPALDAGVWVGMSPSHGLARCLELEVLPRVVAQEQALAETLLGLASGVSAFVEQSRPEGCLVDLQGCRPFEQIMHRGAEAMQEWGREWVVRASQAGIKVRLGIAENPDLALLAAQATTVAMPVRYVSSDCRFLAGLPLEILAPTDGVRQILHGWGIATLGGLARLPRADVVKRLGPEGGALWDQAAGRATRLLRLERVPERYEESYDFEYELETAQPLLFLLRRFLDQLLARLDAVGRVVAVMRLTLPLSDGSFYERSFSIPSPTSDAEALFRVLDTHLETLRLEVAPVGVRLAVEAAAPEHQQFRFFEEAMRDPNRFAQTLARLLALVGEGKVGHPQQRLTHRPDALDLVLPDFSSTASPAIVRRRQHEARKHCEKGGGAAVGVPLRRFRPPIAARVERGGEGKPPRYLASAEVEGSIAQAQGPYRLSGEWWEKPWSVEEWDVALEGGALYRLSCCREGEWVIEGCYERQPAEGRRSLRRINLKGA